MKPQICLVINFLVLNESTRRMWGELARHLAASGVRLVMLSTASHEQPMPFTVIPIPFLLRAITTTRGIRRPVFPVLHEGLPQIFPKDQQQIETAGFLGIANQKPA